MISIVIPVYNTRRYLDETIGSVLQQSYTNWELILVDDGSTDGSVDLIKSYCERDARIRLVEQPNAGQGAARNNGIRQASGELIAFLDSDDFWHPDKLQIQLAEKQQHQVAFQYANGYLMYEQENNRLESYNWIYGAFEGSAFFNELFIKCMVNTDTVLMDKSIFDQVGYFDTDHELRGTEDFDLWLRIARAGYKIYGSQERLAYYRLHPAGTHFNTIKHSNGRIKVFSKYVHQKGFNRQIFLKSYRYFNRDLMDIYSKEIGYAGKIRGQLRLLHEADQFGIVTNLQLLLCYLLPAVKVIQLSNVLIYKIGYRIENAFRSLYL